MPKPKYTSGEKQHIPRRVMRHLGRIMPFFRAIRTKNSRLCGCEWTSIGPHIPCHTGVSASAEPENPFAQSTQFQAIHTNHISSSIPSCPTNPQNLARIEYVYDSSDYNLFLCREQLNDESYFSNTGE